MSSDGALLCRRSRGRQGYRGPPEVHKLSQKQRRKLLPVLAVKATEGHAEVQGGGFRRPLSQVVAEMPWTQPKQDPQETAIASPGWQVKGYD